MAASWVRRPAKSRTQTVVLVIRRIRLLVTLRAPEDRRAAAERAVEVYAVKCPVYRSLCTAIDITTELDFQSL